MLAPLLCQVCPFLPCVFHSGEIAVRICLNPRTAIPTLVHGPAAGVLTTVDDGRGIHPPGLTAQPVTFQTTPDSGGVAQSA